MKQNSTFRRFFSSLSCLVTASILFGYVPAYAELVLPSSRVTSSLKVRSAPNTGSTVVGKLLPGDAAVLLIRPDLSVIHAAYFTRASWKNFLTRSGDFSNACMCSVAAVFNLALVRTGTLV